MAKLKHFDGWGTVRFVTFGCHRRISLLVDEEVIRIVLKHVAWARGYYGFRLFGYVVMPEHIHLVVWPEKLIKLGDVIGTIKWRSAREILAWFESHRPEYMEKLIIGRKDVTRGRRASWGTSKVSQEKSQKEYRVWLPRCYDHNCRNQQTVIEKINYCHWNPVKRGLVSCPEDWKWSSYRWYMDQEDAVIEIDSLL